MQPGASTELWSPNSHSRGLIEAGLALGEGKSLFHEKQMGTRVSEGSACSLQQRNLSYWLAGHVQRGQKGKGEVPNSRSVKGDAVWRASLPSLNGGSVPERAQIL